MRGIEIISRSSVINRIELRKCIELLGQEYTFLPYKMHVYKDIDEVKRESDDNPSMSKEGYEYILGDPQLAPPGVCVHETRLIKIFPFNQLPSQYPVIQSVAFAYHELRHAWQYENGLFTDETESIPIGEELLNYLKKPSEVDAYSFAEEMMNLHMLFIRDIVSLPNGIGFNFTFDLESQIKKQTKLKTNEVR